MNWEPTLWVMAIYLGVIIAIIGGYQAVLHAPEEYRDRIRLAVLAIQGEDYTQPRFDPGMAPASISFDSPHRADDPILAMLVRSSEAELRWFALHHILDQWESQWKHQVATQPDVERGMHRFLMDRYRQAQQQAQDQIASRLEIRKVADEDGLNERYIIEDPATTYRQAVQMSAQQVIRKDPSGGKFPQDVQIRIERFPEFVLQEVEQRSDTLEPRV